MISTAVVSNVKRRKTEKKALIKRLKARHERCEHVTMVDDVRDTLPKADRIIDDLVKSGDVMKITRQKKEILLYTDRAYDLRVNPEFIQSWKKISVEDLDDKKICEFLEKHGHKALTKNTPQQTQLPTESGRKGRRPRTIQCNQHVASQLIDYSNAKDKK